MLDPVEKKLTKARSRLVLDHPFFASLLFKMKMQESQCPTGWTDGRTLGYNPEWVDSLPLDQVIGFLAHEAMHPAMCHHTREGEREHRLWNVACDLAINYILREAGLLLPDKALDEPQYHGWASEKIYADLEGNAWKLDEMIAKAGGDPNSNDPGGCGEVRPMPSDSGNGDEATDSEKKREEELWRVAISQAHQTARAAGKVPGHIERIVEDLVEAKIPWREVLARFVVENSRNDYSWRRPNKRHIINGIYLPRLDHPEVGQLVFMNDSSGSVDDREIALMVSELQGVLLAFFIQSLLIMWIDTEVRGEPQEVSSQEVYDLRNILRPEGGGGTNFRPGFQWLDDHGKDPRAVIYLTDGYCSRFPKREPQYPVLWVIVPDGAKKFEPPFGEVITM
jgi:predicted metal-dependent peptidase